MVSDIQKTREMMEWSSTLCVNMFIHIHIEMCVYICIFQSLLTAPTSNAPVATISSKAGMLVSKYYFPPRGTRASSRNG